MNTAIQQSRRILVVDDSPAIHDDFRKIFAGENNVAVASDIESAFLGESQSEPDVLVSYDIESAFQGETAVNLLENARTNGRHYDLAFVDMRMPPGWDGVETILNLWKLDPELPVVICTAFTDYAWHSVASTLGRRGRWLILKKPFDPVEVSQMAAVMTTATRKPSS